MMEGRGQRVLVVDSDRTVLELLQIRLEVAGYHAYVTRTGADALDSVRNVRPAAMILDVNVDGDGFELLHAIRRRHADAHFPILMTGRGLTVDDVRRVLAEGAQLCMVKPFSGADAVERIGRLLQAQHKPATPAPHPGPMAVHI
jgi:DNA-binding response OmpR family regulator